MRKIEKSDLKIVNIIRGYVILIRFTLIPSVGSITLQPPINHGILIIIILFSLCDIPIIYRTDCAFSHNVLPSQDLKILY